MSHGEWKDVWSLVVSLIGRQSPPAQIFSWLLVVFFVLMLVEGLRATFLPRRVVAQIRRRGSLDTSASVPRRLPAFEPASAPRRTLALASGRNAKRATQTLNRREHTRPTIRRMSSYFEYAAAPCEELATQIESDTRDSVPPET